MLKLKNIDDYIFKTASILTIVTGMDVIICDFDGQILGDSTLPQKKRQRNDLTVHAVVRTSMEEQRIIVMQDSKKENPHCQKCERASICKISSIITYPIVKNGITVGGIGLYARSTSSEYLLTEKASTLTVFLEKISDLLISKLEEAEKLIATEEKNERFRLLIESLDNSLINLDENNSVININTKFYKLFSIPRNSVHSLEDIFQALDYPELIDFIKSCTTDRTIKKASIQIDKFSFTITFKPVLVRNQYRGGLFSFKKDSELYKEINKKLDNFSNITFHDIVGSSQELIDLKKRAAHFAQGPSTIFIQGKSGTGKEMFARAIHSASLRSKGPFITVNCAAVPETLLESELFGHKEGSFTGSMRGGKVGKFEFANKGTLFLDEIGEMPLHLQPKLLRAIQEREIQPIGSNRTIPIDIRIIAATNQNMEEMVKNGLFREDLYYRLNVIPLYIPELKERRQDILDLIALFISQYNSILDRNVCDFDETCKKLLYHYDWPGNIRELQNVVEYAVNDCSGKYIGIENLPPKNYHSTDVDLVKPIRTLKELENLYIKNALKYYGNTPQGKILAAKALGLSRSTFYRKLKELSI